MMLYKIADWSFDSEHGILSRDSVVEMPRLKIVQVLTLLVQNRTRVVTRQELIDRVWAGNAITGQKGLNSVIYGIRSILNEPGENEIIQTMPKRGYRLTAQVEELLPKAMLSPKRNIAGYCGARANLWMSKVNLPLAVAGTLTLLVAISNKLLLI